MENSKSKTTAQTTLNNNPDNKKMKKITYSILILFFLLLAFNLIASIFITTQHTTPEDVIAEQDSAAFQG